MKKPILKLAIIACLPLATIASCGNNSSSITNSSISSEPIVEPPASIATVRSLSFEYNSKKIVGTLGVNLSLKSVQLTVNMDKDDGFTATPVLTSSNEEVAEIASSGLVTLKKKGETIIKGTIGDIENQFALVVADDSHSTPDVYTVTVNGGTADITSVAQGAFVTLTPSIPEHKKFISWTFDDDSDIWQNGNMFKMPGRNVVVTAKFEDMMYSFNLVGAYVSKAGDATDPKGTKIGNTKNGSDEEYDIYSYHFAYDTAISVKAIDSPSGKMFVGFDYGVTNNRVGDMGIAEYGPFTMPDDALTMWGVFSPMADTVFTADSVAGFNDSNRGATTIDKGSVNGTSDPALQGLSGYRIAIPADTGRSADYPENIYGSSFDTTVAGSSTLKAILRNNHKTLPVTVEAYATYYGNLTSSGVITVQPGQTVVKYFSAGLGINDPWWGFDVRADVGGSNSDTVLLDMVVGAAPTYPEGDKLLSVSGKAQYVSLDNYSAGGSWPSGRPKLVNNKVGLTSIAVYAGNFYDVPNGYLTAKVQNMPAFDAKNPTTTIYGKVVNNVNNRKNPTGTFTFAVGKTDSPISGNNISIIDSKQIVIDKIGQVDLFALTIPRTADDGGIFYFDIIKNVIDSSDILWGHNFCVQLTYNNVMGYED